MANIIDTTSDVNNTLLSRREITCDFAGLGGKLRRIDAINMVSKEYDLGEKTVIPMRLQNHVGRPTITGLFYIYEDEALARKHIKPSIFTRLEKSKAKAAEEASTSSSDGDGADKNSSSDNQEKVTS